MQEWRVHSFLWEDLNSFNCIRSFLYTCPYVAWSSLSLTRGGMQVKHMREWNPSADVMSVISTTVWQLCIVWTSSSGMFSSSPLQCVLKTTPAFCIYTVCCTTSCINGLHIFFRYYKWNIYLYLGCALGVLDVSSPSNRQTSKHQRTWARTEIFIPSTVYSSTPVSPFMRLRDYDADNVAPFSASPSLLWFGVLNPTLQSVYNTTVTTELVVLH